MRQRGHRPGLDVHDAQAVAVRTERPEHQAPAVGSERGKGIVRRPGRQLLKAAAVGIDDGDLRAAFGAVLRFQEQSVEAVEEGVERPDAEDDPIAAR